MRLSQVAFASLFISGVVQVAQAQTIEVLYLEGDVIPGIGTVDGGFSSPFDQCAVDDSGSWVVQFEFDDTADVIVRDGVKLIQNGDPAPGGVPAGATVSLNFSSSWDINNSGDIVWEFPLVGTAGGTADNNGLYVNNTLIAQKGSTPPGSWGAGSLWSSFSQATMVDDLSLLRVVGIVDDPTTGATNDWFCSLYSLDGGLNLVSESVLARAEEMLTGMGAGEGVNTVGSSLDGSPINNLGHVMFRTSINNAIAGDSSIYLNTAGTGGVNNMLLAFEGVIEPSSGQPWGSITAPEMSLNDAGDWLIKDQVTGPTSDVIIKNGVVFKFENDTHPDFPGEDIDSFGNWGGKLTASGDVIWFGDFSGSSTSDTGFFLNDTLLVKEGVTMTEDGGIIDELRGLNSTADISPNGRYLIFECEVNNVDAVCLLDMLGSEFDSLCSGDGGDGMGCTDCPCGNNSPMGTVGGCLNSASTSTQLAASGDPSISLPSGDATDLRFTASGSPPTATNVLLSGAAVAPQSMANPCFGLDSGAQAADRDGLRCAVQSVVRHGNRSADAMGNIMDSAGPSRVWGGEAQPNAGIGVQGGFMAGQTRFFQITHRDDAMAVCMRGLNTSQAVEVTFEP